MTVVSLRSGDVAQPENGVALVSFRGVNCRYRDAMLLSLNLGEIRAALQKVE
jgi:hypothetical protein